MGGKRWDIEDAEYDAGQALELPWTEPALLNSFGYPCVLGLDANSAGDRIPREGMLEGMLGVGGPSTPDAASAANVEGSSGEEKTFDQSF